MSNRKHKTEKHTHKLLKSGPVWKCALPECNFFVYFKQEYVLMGRASICNECGDKFPIDEDSLKTDMPICYKCKKPAVVDKFDGDGMEAYLKQKGIM